MGIAVALLLISMGLIIVGVKSINKEKQEQSRIEDYNFAGILNRSEENIDDYKIEIGKLRKEFAETLLEIQGEIVELENKIDELSESSTYESKVSNNINSTLKEVDLVSFTEEIKDTVDISIINEKIYEKDNTTEVTEDEKPNSSNEKNGVKIKEVERLMENGLTIDEISNALKIGKGEVLLIKELYLK